MPIASALYVFAQQHAFPHGRRWLDGPHDTIEAFVAARQRIETAGGVPGARLDYATRRGKSLPDLRWQPDAAVLADEGYDLRKRAERERCADDIAAAARALGATVVIENWDGEPDVDITLPGLRATIWLAWFKAAPMPIISWYGAQYPLQAVPGAWTDADVNSSHRRKATSLPASWPELFDMLEAGICAAVDGTAFELEGNDHVRT